MSRVLYHLSYTAGESAGGRLRDRADAGTEREGGGGVVAAAGFEPATFGL